MDYGNDFWPFDEAEFLDVGNQVRSGDGPRGGLGSVVEGTHQVVLRLVHVYHVHYYGILAALHRPLNFSGPFSDLLVLVFPALFQAELAGGGKGVVV